jgi:SAM-dependent methyltransferase
MDRPRVDYDQLAAVYDRRYSIDELAGIGRVLRDLASRTHARRILEVGCGTGRWLGELAPDTRIICGADSSPGMLAAGKAKLPEVPVVAARANALPFKPGFFDVVFSVNAIHHFDDPRDFVTAAAALLTPGGALAVAGIDPRLIRQRYFYEYFEGTYELDLRRFPAVGDLVNWMAAAGFTRIEYRIADRYRRTFRGSAVLSDPFLRKESSSLMALLTDAAYERGLRRIEAAASADAEFTSDLTFPVVAGWIGENR